MQDRLQVNEKSLNQFKNRLRRIRRLRLKQGQKTNLSKTKQMQEALKVKFKKKINFIKKVWYTKKCTSKYTKKKEII